MRSSKLQALALACAIALLALMAHTTCAQSSPDEVDEFVNGHNAARAAVGLGPVSWDDQVAAYAQNYANEQVGDCRKLVHSGGPYGENLYMGPAGGDWTAKSAVDLWVGEQQYYHYDSNTCDEGEQCGHYTQIVWADSTSIGCARVVCDNGNVFIICSYNPRGNINDQKPYP